MNFSYRYLIRSCGGKLRIGVSEATVLAAIARAVYFDEGGEKTKFNKEKVAEIEAKIKEAFVSLPNFTVLMDAIIKHGVQNLEENVGLQPGVPLKVTRKLICLHFANINLEFYY